MAIFVAYVCHKVYRDANRSEYNFDFIKKMQKYFLYNDICTAIDSFTSSNESCRCRCCWENFIDPITSGKCITESYYLRK